MKDSNKIVRDALWNALQGTLSYNDIPIPVNDEVLNISDNANYYVLLTNQTSSPDWTKQSFDEEGTITIQVVSKTSAVTKNIVDDITNQILTLLFPTPHSHTLTLPSGWQILNLRKSDDRYDSLLTLTTANGMRRILTLSFRVVQN